MSKNVVEIKFTAKDLTAGAIKGLNRSLGLLGTTVKGVGNQLFSLKGLLAGVGAGVGAGVVAKSFFDAASTAEGLQTRLSVLLGSVEEGNRLFADMTKFAGQVPFQYEEIMQSATQLSGILKGGVDEINEWMPLIGDLAATSGLSIQQTTEQVSRMLSAGAASADLFRERGITAMLGFTSGVTYSVEETRRRLIEAWDEPNSKFRGATEKLATTWEGILSMIADKWFNLRTTVMDAGVLDYFKALAKTVDSYFGKALDDSKTQAKGWAQFIIDAIRSTMNAIGSLINIIHNIRIAFTAVQFAFAASAEAIVQLILDIADGFRSLADLVGFDIKPMQGLEDLLGSMKTRTQELADELDTRLADSMPGDAVAAFAAQVEENFNAIQAKAKETGAVIKNSMQLQQDTGGDGGMASEIEKRYALLDKSLRTETERINIEYETRLMDLENAYLELGLTDEEYLANRARIQEAYDQRMRDATRETASEYTRVWSQTMTTFSRGIGDAIGSAIVEQQDLAKTLENVMKGVVRQVISSLMQIGVNMALQRNAQVASLATTAGAVATTASTIATAAAPAATMTSLMSFGANSAPAIAGMTAAATTARGLALFSQAHAGIDNVPRDETFLLRAGERVVQPEANKDLTRFLAREDRGVNNGSRSIVVQQMNVSVLENATTGDALLQLSAEDISRLVEEKLLPAFDSLNEQGIGFAEAERAS